MIKKVSVISLFLLLISLSSCSKPSINENLFAMDTVMSFSLKGENAKECLSEIESEIIRLENIFSVNKQDSEISKINSSTDAVYVCSDTANIIKKATEISALTDGAFDISIYPLVKLWGFTEKDFKVPTDDQIAQVIKSTDYKKIEIDDNKIRFDGQIDLGGIAKGYACDKISKILKKHNIEEAIISLGGNILIKGNQKTVGIAHPNKSDELICTLKATNTSIVTSGGYQRNFSQDGKIYHHILDPKTGKPAQSGIISATIICDNSTLADGLSTAVYIMGTDKAIKFWKENQNFDMIIIDNQNIYATVPVEVTDKTFKLNIIE